MATKLLIFLFLSILFIPLALSLTLTSPDSVSLNEEFEVSISDYAEIVCDVKIFVHTSEEEKISRAQYISEIYNGGWQDPWFYLSSSYPEQKEYKIRVVSSPGDRKICLRLRNPESKEFLDEACNEITIEDESRSSEKKETKQEKEEISSNSKEPEPVQEETLTPISYPENEILQDKIVLNPKKDLAKTDEVLVTKNDKTRTVLIISFTGFCLILLIFLALKRL